MIKILDRKAEEWLLIGGFFSLIILVFFQFLSRYVFDYSLSWAQELSRYLLIWLAWISVSFTIREKKHIRVETLKDLLPPKGQIVVEIIVLFLWSIFAIFLSVIGMEFVLSIESSGQGSPMMGIPMWLVYVILPLAGVLMFLRLIQQFVLLTKKKTV